MFMLQQQPEKNVSLQLSVSREVQVQLSSQYVCAYLTVEKWEVYCKKQMMKRIFGKSIE